MNQCYAKMIIYPLPSGAFLFKDVIGKLLYYCKFKFLKGEGPWFFTDGTRSTVNGLEVRQFSN